MHVLIIEICDDEGVNVVAAEACVATPDTRRAKNTAITTDDALTGKFQGFVLIFLLPLRRSRRVNQSLDVGDWALLEREGAEDNAAFQINTIVRRRS